MVVARKAVSDTVLWVYAEWQEGGGRGGGGGDRRGQSLLAWQSLGCHPNGGYDEEEVLLMLVLCVS